MKHKDGKNVDFQGFIDYIVEDHDFVDYTDKKIQEVECHLDVDLVLNEPIHKYHAHKKLRSLKNNPSYYASPDEFVPQHANSNVNSHIQNYPQSNHYRHSKIQFTGHVDSVPHIIYPRREKLIMNLHDKALRKQSAFQTLMSLLF